MRCLWMKEGRPSPTADALDVYGVILLPKQVLRPRPKAEPPVQVLDTDGLELPGLQHSRIRHHLVPVSFFSQLGILDCSDLCSCQFGRLLLRWWRLFLRCLGLRLALNRSLSLRQFGALHFYFVGYLKYF